jgi:anti-sigma-K factor RskA
VSQLRHIDQEDLALYALQLLSADEAAQVAEHLKTCSECSAEVAALQGDMVAYALSAEMLAPPVAAKQRLFQQIAREKKVVSMAAPATFERGETESGQTLPEVSHEATQASIGRSQELWDDARLDDVSPQGLEVVPPSVLSRTLPWLGWPVAAGLAIAAVSLYQQRAQLQSSVISESTRIAALTEDAARGEALIDVLTDRGAMRVTLNETAGKEPVKPKPQGRATYVASKGTLVFLASNLAPLDPQKTYELWLIPAEAGLSPIPAGTFQPDSRGNANVVMPTLPKGIEAKAFGVTIEEEGGSKTPTAPIVLAGA